jgi:Family of unknown function (DUF5906)
LSSALSPFTDQSLAFLEKAQPGGDWILVSIGKGSPLSATFNPHTSDKCKEWIISQTKAMRDIYFRCAFAIKCSGKDGAMEDRDVTGVNLLWADIDVKGKDKKEKAGILGHIQRRLGKDKQPTFIDDSGNGFHLFWQFQRTLKIGVDLSLTDLSAHLYGLAKALGGDTKCRNPSRLLRLPGTWNVKNPAQPLLCYTIETNEVQYELEDFAEYKDDSFISVAPAEAREVIPVVEYDLDALNLPAELRQKIETGINPKTGLRWVDRSQLMNHVAVELVKCGIDSSIILAILLDKRYLHAGHLWDCREPLREARRTLNWALNASVDDAISRINRNYFMVCIGGHVIYGYDDRESAIPKAPREIITKGDFLTEIAHIKESYTNEEGEVCEVNVYKKWIEDEKRRRWYPDGYIVDPTYSHGNGVYNLWRGYGVRPDRHPWAYMRENISCLSEGNARYVDYVMNWCALLVQHPTIIPRTALVFHGDQGTGKSLFADSLCRIMGIHSTVVKQPDQLAGRFSGHLQGKIFIQADECEFDHKGMGVLKALISDPTMPVEKKGTQIFTVPNYSHIVLTSNADKVLPLDPGNRRFIIFQPLRTHKGDKQFWADLVDEMENGGYEGMLYDLLSRDIKGWSPEFDRPETASMIHHKQHSLSNAKSAVQTWLENGDCTMLMLHQVIDSHHTNAREVKELMAELGIDFKSLNVPADISARWLERTGIELKLGDK